MARYSFLVYYWVFLLVVSAPARGQVAGPPSLKECKDRVFTKGGRSTACRIETVLGNVLYFSTPVGSGFGANALPADSVLRVEIGTGKSRRILAKSDLFVYQEKEPEIEVQKPLLKQNTAAFFFLPMVGVSYWIANSNSDVDIAGINDQIAAALQRELKIGYTFKGGFGPFAWVDYRKRIATTDKYASYVQQYSYGLGVMWHIPFERSKGFSTWYLGVGQSNLEANYTKLSQYYYFSNSKGGSGTGTVVYLGYNASINLSDPVFIGGDFGLIYGETQIGSGSTQTTESLTKIKAAITIGVRL